APSNAFSSGLPPPPPCPRAASIDGLRPKPILSVVVGAPTGTGHVLHFAHEFLESGGSLHGRLGGYSCRRRARVSRCRYAIRRLSHRSGAHVYGTTRRGGHWRAAPHSRVSFWPTWARGKSGRTTPGLSELSPPHPHA